MKSITSPLLYGLMLLSFSLSAQPPGITQYSYDQNGNRLKRIFLSTPQQSIVQPTNTQNPESENITPSLISGHPTTAVNNQDVSWSIMPNPTANSFVISVSGMEDFQGSYTAILIDGNGKLLHQYELSCESQTIQLSPYPNGLYYLEIVYKGNRNIFRILKNG